MGSGVWRVLLAAMVAALVLALSEPVGAEGKDPSTAEAAAPAAKRCRIGRRAYCYKYKALCEGDASAACGAWFDACWTCHDIADRCRRDGGDCDTCRAGWSRCMGESYKAHWPAKARQ